MTGGASDPAAFAEALAAGVGAEEAAREEAAARAVALLMAAPPLARPRLSDALGALATDLQRDASHRARLLQGPIADLASHGGEDSSVAAGLKDLTGKIAALDPNRFDFSESWWGKLLQAIGLAKPPAQRYFARFEASAPTLDAALRDLGESREQLRRDNLVLEEDAAALEAVAAGLDAALGFGEALSARLDARATAPEADAAARAFIETEATPQLSRRLSDLRVHRLVVRQGLAAIGVVAGGNRELIRGIDQTVDLAAGALRVATASAAATARRRLAAERISETADASGALARAAVDGMAEAARGEAPPQRPAQPSASDLGGGEPRRLNALKTAFQDLGLAIETLNERRRSSAARAQTGLDAFAAEIDGAGAASVGETRRP